jgi:hypothetical protein
MPGGCSGRLEVCAVNGFAWSNHAAFEFDQIKQYAAGDDGRHFFDA